MQTTKITPDQAAAEIARRAVPRTTRPRSNDPATFRLTGPELAKLAAKAGAKKAPAVKAARPTGPGSRGGDPAKAARAAQADLAGARGTTAWWVAYRAAK